MPVSASGDVILTLYAGHILSIGLNSDNFKHELLHKLIITPTERRFRLLRYTHWIFFPLQEFYRPNKQEAQLSLGWIDRTAYIRLLVAER